MATASIEVVGAREAAGEWSWPRLFALRFAVLYFVSFAFPFPFAIVAGFERVDEIADLVARPLVWLASAALRTPMPPGVANGSGDRSYDFYATGARLVLAIALALVWTALDRRRARPAALVRALRFYVRLFLGTSLLLYGVDKLIPAQMSAPLPSRLLQPVGEMSPMGLLWTFMGSSPAYEMFAGAAETLAGLLILWRRTATLGALVAIGAMAHVVMLNFCYDVPVKLLSSHLLLLSVALAWPELPRLFAAVRGDAVGPVVQEVPERRWLRIGETAACLLFGALTIGIVGHDALGALRARRDQLASPAFGAWTIEGSPLYQRAFLYPALKGARMIAKEGGSTPFKIALDEAQRSVTLTPATVPGPARALTWSAQPGVLEGDWPEGRVRLQRIDTSKMLLLSRGFHLISEAPFNR